MTTTDMGLGPGKRGDAPAAVAPGGRAGRRPMLHISRSAVLAVGFTALIAVAVGSALALGFVAARESTLALVRDRVGVILSTVSDRLEAHLRQVEDQMSEIREAVVSG
ncbi:MAG: hypothetical protein JNK11_02200, partial [Alphaproteobacteria bacterium]|nr:hypothetical protein [Alphaproteobacteria bacterium]